MRLLLSILTAAALATAITAQAEIIASCGPLEGYSYFPGDASVGVEPKWVSGPLPSAIIFIGTGRVEDVILKSTLKEEDWTRSASDYGANVHEIFRDGPVRQILVLWGPVTELYALDTEKKVLTLVSQKSGFIKVSHAFAGECE